MNPIAIAASVFVWVVAAFFGLIGRRTERRCSTCRFYVDEACKRFPPVPMRKDDLDVTRFPTPNPNWHCGEWKAWKWVWQS